MPTSVFLSLGSGGEQFVGQMIGPAADNTANPPFTFAGDLDTGLGSSAANTLSLVVGGNVYGSLSSAGTLSIFHKVAVTGPAGEVNVDNAGFIYWGTRAVLTSPADAIMILSNNATTVGAALDTTTADTLRVKNFANNALGTVIAAQFQNANATNGQKIGDLQTLTELTTIAAAASTDTTIQMPATSVVLGVAVRVVTVIPTAATFTVGDSGSAARFSTAAVAVAAGSTDPGTKAGAYYNASALAIRITPNAQPGAATGQVRVCIFYYTVTPPSS